MRALIVVLATFLSFGARATEETPVDLELVLAVDVSWSMDYDEQVLQRAGYVAALRDPMVLQAIMSGGWGRIALTYVEWAGMHLQSVVVPWTLIDSAETADAFASHLDGINVGRLRRTSISGGLEFAARMFDGNGYAGLRRVIDISGDGANNEGMPVVPVRDRLVQAGIIINGLPVMVKTGNPGGFQNIENLDIYYEDCVIGGTGAFVLPVTDVSRFASAIRQKLILEIAGLNPPALPLGPRIIPAQYQEKVPRIDCLIGEKMWERRQRYLEW